MEGQLTIFDFIKTDDIAIEDMTEEQLLKSMEEALGVKFKAQNHVWDNKDDGTLYMTKKGKGDLYFHFSRYDVGSYGRFIAVGWDNTHAGGGAPCDSLEEAIKKMRVYMKLAGISK